MHVLVRNLSATMSRTHFFFFFATKGFFLPLAKWQMASMGIATDSVPCKFYTANNAFLLFIPLSLHLYDTILSICCCSLSLPLALHLVPLIPTRSIYQFISCCLLLHSQQGDACGIFLSSPS